MGEIQTRENGSLVCHETGQVRAGPASAGGEGRQGAPLPRAGRGAAGRVSASRPAAPQLQQFSCCMHPCITASLSPLRHPLAQVTAYAIDSVQQRGRLFVSPGDQVYEGQVIGIYQRQGDLKVSPKDCPCRQGRSVPRCSCAVVGLAVRCACGMVLHSG